jgi:outer membrane protein assembly factor BamD
VTFKTGHILSIFSAFLLLSIFGCGSSNDQFTKPVVTPGSPDQHFAEGKAAYDKGDWTEAIRIFEEVRVQTPTLDLASQATYLEAMARFNEGMYSGAAVDFLAVRRNYPNAPVAARAQYMVGESYYEISPRAELDQSYTSLAINGFQNFLHSYPNAPQTLIDSAQHRIVEIRNKLAYKTFLSAQLYEKLSDPKSALVYYARILDQYYDSPYAPESELRIAEINYDRKQMDNSRKALDAFDAKYLQAATSDERSRALKLRAKLPNP